MLGPVYNSQPIPLHAVYGQQDLYDNYPPCQREFVWPDTYKQRLIDSILRGLPIPAGIVVIEEAFEEGLFEAIQKYWVIDG